MALDGIVLDKINKELNANLPYRIVKINNLSDSELLLQLKGNGTKTSLLISLHSQFNRINLTKKHYENPIMPNNFVMLLRKYLENGIITAIEQFDYDRYLKFTICGHDELGEKDKHYLFVELMGKYANCILVDENMKIKDALKRIPPFENQNRTILPNADFTYCPYQKKNDIYSAQNYNDALAIYEQFAGFSPLLSKEFEYRLHNNEDFKDIINELKNSNDLYVYKQNDQVIYHVIELKHLNSEYIKYPLMEGLDEIYSHKEQIDRIRQNIGDLFKLCKKELKRNENKKEKLLISLSEANDLEKWRVYGDLIFANLDKIHKGQTEAKLFNYYTNEETLVPLESKLDPKANGRKCYQKYNKFKNGQIQIQHQIDLCDQEIEYFKNILAQLNIMDINDANEVREELVNNGYLKDKKKIKKKKEVALNFLTIKYDDETTIYVGKNNKQNDFLTFKKARKEDYFFHAADYHGSHTILKTNKLTEDKIRLCAMLASYYSQARDSSSIPVRYTLVKNLKKIPDSKMGLVSMSEYKTIYIDIDLEKIKKYCNQKA